MPHLPMLPALARVCLSLVVTLLVTMMHVHKRVYGFFTGSTNCGSMHRPCPAIDPSHACWLQGLYSPSKNCGEQSVQVANYLNATSNQIAAFLNATGTATGNATLVQQAQVWPCVHFTALYAQPPPHPLRNYLKIFSHQLAWRLLLRIYVLRASNICSAHS